MEEIAMRIRYTIVAVVLIAPVLLPASIALSFVIPIAAQAQTVIK